MNVIQEPRLVRAVEHLGIDPSPPSCNAIWRMDAIHDVTMLSVQVFEFFREIEAKDHGQLGKDLGVLLREHYNRIQIELDRVRLVLKFGDVPGMLAAKRATAIAPYSDKSIIVHKT